MSLFQLDSFTICDIYDISILYTMRLVNKTHNRAWKLMMRSLRYSNKNIGYCVRFGIDGDLVIDVINIMTFKMKVYILKPDVTCIICVPYDYHDTIDAVNTDSLISVTSNIVRLFEDTNEFAVLKQHCIEYKN